MKKAVLMVVLLLAAGLWLNSCSRQEKPGKEEPVAKLAEPEQWAQAQKQNDIKSYDAYVSYYPDGPNAQKAKEALRKLWQAKDISVAQMQNLTAVIETNRGVIKFKFFQKDAPETCRNFIRLAESHFYDGLIFHRVVDGFVIQGGDPFGNGTGGPGYNVKAEFNNQKHLEGTVAMARSASPDSAGSQFYICLAPQPMLDGKYTVFGQVTEGMDAVHAIGSTRTGAGDRPIEPQVMKRVYIEGL